MVMRNNRMVAELDADASGYNRAMREASSSTMDFARSAGMSFTQLTGAVALGDMIAGATRAAAREVGIELRASIDEASRLEETQNKVNEVLGESAVLMHQWAEGAADGMGLAKREALEAGGSLANMFNQLGIGTQQSADLSMSMVALASDFASFHDADITEVLVAQQAAFRGEYDAVQRFVPVINAAAVEEQALRMGLAATSKEVTEQDKALATHALLLEGAGKAKGDYARTSDSAANAERGLKAQITDLRAEIGERLLPHYRDLIAATRDWISTNGDDFAESLGEAVEYASDTAQGMLDTLRDIRDSGPYQAVINMVDGEGNLITLATLAALGFRVGGPVGAGVAIGGTLGKIAADAGPKVQAANWFETLQITADDVFGPLFGRTTANDRLPFGIGGETPWQRAERQRAHLEGEGGYYDDSSEWGPFQAVDPTRPISSSNPAMRTGGGAAGSGERRRAGSTTGGGSGPDAYSPGTLGLMQQILTGLPEFNLNGLDEANLNEYRAAEREFAQIRQRVNRDIAELSLEMSKMDAQGLENTAEFKAMKDQADGLKEAMRQIDLVEDLRLLPAKEAMDAVGESVDTLREKARQLEVETQQYFRGIFQQMANQGVRFLGNSFAVWAGASGMRPLGDILADGGTITQDDGSGPRPVEVTPA